MRPTEEKRQQTIKTYLKLLRELKRKREIKRITELVKSYDLHNSVASRLTDMGIIDRDGWVCYWIYKRPVNMKLATAVYYKVNEERTKAVVKSMMKNTGYTPKNYEPPAKFKQRYDFAKMHGFGEHSPISKMIAHLEKQGEYRGIILFERSFKDWMKRGRLITEIIQADQRDNLYA